MFVERILQLLRSRCLATSDALRMAGEQRAMQAAEHATYLDHLSDELRDDARIDQFEIACGCEMVF